MSPPLAHVEAVILAGGASARMGRDKASLELFGEPLALRVARPLQACFERVSIALRPGAPSPLALPRVDDAHDARAPIVGIAAALGAARTSAVLVVACDLPEIDPALLLALAALVPAEGAPDAVVPVGPRGPEPLLAIYRPRLRPLLEERIARGDLALRPLLDAVDTRRVPEDVLRAIDPELRSLRNLNRPEDLRAFQDRRPEG